MEKKVQKVIDEIRPMIQADGGDVTLVDIDEKNGVVTLELHGACIGCPLSHVTLKAGIEKMLREKVKGIKTVQAV